jgi:hypothetical protein
LPTVDRDEQKSITYPAEAVYKAIDKQLGNFVSETGEAITKILD